MKIGNMQPTVSGKKLVYDNTKTWMFNNPDGGLAAAYMPNMAIDADAILMELNKIQFTRVYYISQYHKANRTPRLTWAWGQVNSNMPNPDFNPNSEDDRYSKLATIPNPEAAKNPEVVEYRGLDFYSEVMPPWLEALSQYCRMVSVMNWGFDGAYNSVIIGKYEDGEDSIGFHTDASPTYQEHFLCANVSLGFPRDFQFKTENADGTKQTHQIKLDHKSLFFFIGLEHALPPRKGIATGSVRYSISFRAMKNDIGIGNGMYYCRGLAGAIDNEKKRAYEAELKQLQVARAEGMQE